MHDHENMGKKTNTTEIDVIIVMIMNNHQHQQIATNLPASLSVCLT